MSGFPLKADGEFMTLSKSEQFSYCLYFPGSLFVLKVIHTGAAQHTKTALKSLFYLSKLLLLFKAKTHMM